MKKDETPEQAEKRKAYGREYMRKRRLEDPELNRRTHKKMLEKHPDYWKQWHYSHRTERIAQAKDWKRKNPHWRRADPDKYRERNRRDAQNRAGRRRGYPPISKAALAEVWDSYAGLCVYCLGPAEHFDHIVSLATGGPHTAENLAPACARCNCSKNRTPLLVWLARKGGQVGKGPR